MEDGSTPVYEICSADAVPGTNKMELDVMMQINEKTIEDKHLFIFSLPCLCVHTTLVKQDYCAGVRFLSSLAQTSTIETWHQDFFPSPTCSQPVNMRRHNGELVASVAFIVSNPSAILYNNMIILTICIYTTIVLDEMCKYFRHPWR
jgi:hypothetical protein